MEKKFKVALITRPRRFGKTLNMTTLKYFLDIENAEQNRRLFNNLHIEKTRWIDEQGKYPVIFLTMKDLKGENFQEFFQEFKTLLRKLYGNYAYLRDSLEEWDRIEFDKILFKKEDAEYLNSLSFLSELLYSYHGVKPVLLIDEYDAPMIKADEKGYYKEVKELIGNFYGVNNRGS